MTLYLAVKIKEDVMKNLFDFKRGAIPMWTYSNLDRHDYLLNERRRKDDASLCPTSPFQLLGKFGRHIKNNSIGSASS